MSSEEDARTLKFSWWYWILPVGSTLIAAFAVYVMFLAEFHLIGKLVLVVVAVVAAYHALRLFSSRIVIGPNYLEERHFLKGNRVYFGEVTSVIANNNGIAFCSTGGCVVISSDVAEGVALGAELLEKIRSNHDIEIKADILSLRKYGLLQQVYEGERSLPEKEDGDGRAPSWQVKQTKNRWLYRAFLVRSEKKEYKLEYIGRGKGFEAILVDNQIFAAEQGFWWYVPKFEFVLEGREVIVTVSVSPWLSIRSFVIEVDGFELYREGK